MNIEQMTRAEINACWDDPMPSGCGRSRYDITDAILATRDAQWNEALAAQRVPADCDVRKILLEVVPGDGDGFEVFAKNVADVEAKLCDLGGRLEDWELGIRRHPSPVAPPQPACAGWSQILVETKSFDNLISAMDRAERKGYLPDAVVDEWLQFDYKTTAPAQQSTDASPAGERETATLKERLSELTEKHGSLRGVARMLGCDVGYLSRLASGTKTAPGEGLLHYMGLREVITYERVVPAPDNCNHPGHDEGWSAAQGCPWCSPRAALATKPPAPVVAVDKWALPPEYMLAKLQIVMPLFQEARDALTAITEAQRKLHGISSSLDVRMDEAGTFSLDDWTAARDQKGGV